MCWPDSPMGGEGAVDAFPWPLWASTSGSGQHLLVRLSL